MALGIQRSTGCTVVTGEDAKRMCGPSLKMTEACLGVLGEAGKAAVGVRRMPPGIFALWLSARLRGVGGARLVAMPDDFVWYMLY